MSYKQKRFAKGLKRGLKGECAMSADRAYSLGYLLGTCHHKADRKAIKERAIRNGWAVA